MDDAKWLAGRRLDGDQPWGSTLPVSSYVGSHGKRAFDVCAASLLMIVLGPMLIMLAIAVKATSEGPVIFRQKRYGMKQRVFWILKFRSMHRQTPEHVLSHLSRQSAHVTGLGSVLRRASLDELPQLLNVLRGEMSLVGPRPHAVYHDEFFVNRIPHYSRRFSIRPGITGLAQVSGERGVTRTDADMQRRLALDIWYLENASPLLDMKILLATAHEVLFSKCAC